MSCTFAAFNKVAPDGEVRNIDVDYALEDADEFPDEEPAAVDEVALGCASTSGAPRLLAPLALCSAP